MSNPRSKSFPTADVLGALFYYALSVTAEGEMDNAASYHVGNFMVGEESGETLDVPDLKAFHAAIAADLRRQHPDLAKVDIEELKAIQSAIPFIPHAENPAAHEASRQAHITAIRQWVEAQVAKLGAAELIVEEMPRELYPRRRAMTAQELHFALEAASGQEPVDLSREGSEADFVERIKGRKVPPQGKGTRH